MVIKISVVVRTRNARLSRASDLIDDPQRVEGARISDERQKLRQNIDQPGAVVANIDVRGDMALDLRFASDWKGQLRRLCTADGISAVTVTSRF